MKIFDLVRNQLQFVFAKRFHNLKGESFSYTPTLFEKLGEKLLTPFKLPMDVFLRYFNWQLILLGLVVCSIVGTTLFYYPNQIAILIEWIVPIINREKAKFLCYILLQLYLNGMLLRSLGRLSNQVL